MSENLVPQANSIAFEFDRKAALHMQGFFPACRTCPIDSIIITNQVIDLLPGGEAK